MHGRRPSALFAFALAAAPCACAWCQGLAADEGVVDTTPVASAPPAEAPRPERSWRVVPRLGFSYATGMLGAEIQLAKVGVGAGVLVTPRFCILCSQDEARRNEDGAIRIFSARYYLDAGNAWAIGPFYARENHVLGGDEFVGVGAEFVLRGASAWQLGVGLAVVAQSGSSRVDVLPSVAVGYAL